MEPSAEERLKETGASIPTIPQHISVQPAPGVQSPLAPHKHSRIVPMLAGLFALILIIAIGLGSAVVYASVQIPFLSSDQEKIVNLLMYRIPFLPKTPKQILLAASETKSIITRYTPEFSMSGTVSNTAISLASFDVKIAGPLDFTPGSPAKFDLTLDGGVSVAGTSYTTSGKVQKSGEVVYGKIDAVSDSILDLYLGFAATGQDPESSREEMSANVKKVFENWVMYDISSIDSEARDALTNRNQDQSLIDTTRRDAQRVLLEEAIVNDIKRLPDEVVDNTSTYHLQYAPDSEGIRAMLGIVRDIAQEKSSSQTMSMTDKDAQQAVDRIAESVKKLTVDVYIGKSDLILRRMSLQTDIIFPELADMIGNYSTSSSSPAANMIVGQLVDITLSTSLVLTVRDIGKDFTVTPPVTSVIPSAYGSMFQDALVTEEQRNAQAMRKQYDDDFGVLRNSLTKYFARNFMFPELLTALQDAGLSGQVSARLSDYTYQRSVNGQEYVLYVEYTPYQSYYEPTTGLYGITSDYSYPRSLSIDDLKIVQEDDQVSIPQDSVLTNPSPFVYGVMDMLLKK